MKIFDSRKSIAMASMGVLFATLALVSCEKREEPLLNGIEKYSKIISFNQVEKTTRSVYTDINNQLPNATYVLQTELGDTLYLQEYVSDIDEEWMTRATEFKETDLTVFDILAYNVKADGTLEANTDLCKKVGNNNGTWSYGAISNQSEINWSALGDNNVKFVAYANLPDNTTDNIVVTPISQTEFKLYLPTESVDQKDIVVAKGAVKNANGVVQDVFNSSFNKQVPLEFEHILAQVAFVVDENLSVPGTFTKAEIVDYPSKGAVYDIINNTWNMDNAEKQTLTLSGDNITSDAFMVVPQEKEMSGSTAFKFHFTPSSANGLDQTFDVPLAGTKWEAGKKYTYKVSNNAIDLCSFTSYPDTVDAHYSIVEINVSSRYGCQIVSENSNVTFNKSEDLIDLQRQGYWIKRGTGTGYQNRQTTLNIAAGPQTIYAHIEQNLTSPVDDALRALNLTLKPKTSNNSGYSSDEKNIDRITINQFAPNWTLDGIGCERIEEITAEMWGPYWVLLGNEQPTVTYKIAAYQMAFSIIEALFTGQLGALFDLGLINYSLSGGIFTGTYTIVFDYSSFLNINNVESTSGFINTYNATGSTNIEKLSVAETIFGRYDKNPSKTFKTVDYSLSAILSSQKKNAYTYTVVNGENVPILAEDDKIWFLPSEKECTDKVLQNKYVEDELVPGQTVLSGVYWTSNAVVKKGDDLDPAVKYTAKTFTITNAKTGEGTIAEASRTNLYNIRACCKGPATQKSLNQEVE